MLSIIYMLYSLYMCHIHYVTSLLIVYVTSMYHISYIRQNRYNMYNKSLSLSLSLSIIHTSISYIGVNIAVCCSELQYEVMSFWFSSSRDADEYTLQHTATHCNTNIMKKSVYAALCCCEKCVCCTVSLWCGEMLCGAASSRYSSSNDGDVVRYRI